ncbi:hypothetical protein U9K52_09925 [Chryseobacterium sp. MHB01]|uniref:hypothetical protein n=1 Tax=Chryseobacterium sp. MHB01 TaxID=3109433 RepID=UPI002AFF0BF3|nr:hypothetical protein [Chryseobacterium sp. MHB01]MEA1849230.1 hypothetical protein [Chryseobacterium sp. MHB01]
MKILHITVELDRSLWLGDAVDNCIELAKVHQCIVKFDFNGIQLEVTQKSKKTKVVEQYNEIKQNNFKPLSAI